MSEKGAFALQTPTHITGQIVPLAAEMAEPLTQFESVEQVLERLRCDLDIVPEADVDDSLPSTTYVGDELSNGRHFWHRWSGEDLPEGAKEIVQDGAPDSAILFKEAADKARENDDLLLAIAREAEGRWWTSSLAEKSVQRGIREGFRIREGRNEADILNCSEHDLTPEQQQSMAKVFGAVSTFTGGKIFDRIKGIVLAPDEDFEKRTVGKDKKLKSVLGIIQIENGVISINIDRILEDKSTFERYAKYLEGIDTDLFEVTLAHELGHAMDIKSMQEVKAHDLDTERISWSWHHDFSTFQEMAGWLAVKGGGAFATKTEWSFNGDETIECVPTDYGLTNPKEDFAETFAIAALGGDLSSMPERQKKLAETIQKAQGEGQIGPKLASIESIDLTLPYPPIKADKLGLRICTKVNADPLMEMPT
jgi:hypothetical protein